MRLNKVIRLAALQVMLVSTCLMNPPPALGQTMYQTVHSADGTEIGFTRIGSGPAPIVIVHGALNSGAQWFPVARDLSDQFTCYVMDRWGRGGSGKHSDYSVHKEAEDIVAVLEAAGPNAILLGHSSGAIYALEAARLHPPAKLILYEPPIHAFHGRFAHEIWGPIRNAANDEDYDKALSIFLGDEVGLSNNDLTHLKSTPLWKTLLNFTPQSVTEWAALVRDKPTVERYRNIAVPTLLLTGSKNAHHPSFATRALDEMWPPKQARVVVLKGQAHTAHLEAPELLADKINDFILDSNDQE